MLTQEAVVTILTDFSEISSQRHGDMEIMCLFVQSGWKQPEIQTLNQCRMFLKVFLLLEIVDGSGDHITSQFWDHLHLAVSSYMWPCSCTPTLSSWKLWQKALSTFLHLGQNQQLALPLGKWYAQTWPWGWYYHTDTNSLWLKTPTQWIQHRGIPQRT